MEQGGLSTNRGLRLVGYAVLVAATLVGLWAIVVRFSSGLIATNLTQHVPWGLWVSLYIYLVGLSVGGFLVVTLIYVFGVERFRPLGPLALIQALVCMFLGLFMIWVDLGHPARFFNVFLHWNPTSILAWESVLYSVYVLIILAMLYLVLKPSLARMAAEGGPLRGLYRLLSLGGEAPDASWRQKAERRLKVVGCLGLVVAIFVRGGTGALFAVIKSRPTWYTGLLPIIFLVSASVSGVGLLTLLAAAAMPIERARKLRLLQSLLKIIVGLVVLEVLLHASEALVTFYGGIPSHVTAWKLMLFGPYWWIFWIVQLGLGVLVPILVIVNRSTAGSIRCIGATGLAVVVGALGGWFNAVIPPLIAPEFPGLPEAYQHFRNAVGYFPSVNEWLVGVGAVAVGIWALLLALRVLPLNGTAAKPVSEGGSLS